MAGRKKTPTKMKILKGTAQKCRINKNEPVPKVAKLATPSYLDAQGKRTFADMAKLIADMRISAASDKHALAMMADMHSIYRKMRKILEVEGFTYETTNQHGDTMFRARPEVAILSDAWKNVRSMMSEFGLTPSARAKVSATGEKEEDPLKKFLLRKNG